MKTKQFTLLQLFSIIDGRLSTNIEDVYDMLNHITSESLMTHHLPVAMDYIKKTNPEWFNLVQNDLTEIKSNIGNGFLPLIDFIKENNTKYNIPPLTEK